MVVSSPGALIYLLNLFCNSQNPSVREETAGLIAKMITDKLVGPKVRIVLSKFLPLIFMDAMRDSAEASVHMFESTFTAVAQIMCTVTSDGIVTVLSACSLVCHLPPPPPLPLHGQTLRRTRSSSGTMRPGRRSQEWWQK